MRKRFAFLVGAALIAAAAPVSAGQIFTSFNSGASTYGSAKMTLNGGSSWTNVGAGRLAFTRTGGDYLGLLDPILLTFCIEPTQWVQSTAVYNVTPLAQGNDSQGGMGANRAALVNQLIARNQSVMQGPISRVVAEAIQFAIWEIVSETSNVFNVSLGNARFFSYDESGAVALAQSYLNALTLTGPQLANIRALVRNGVQDQLVIDRTPISQVPEPAALGLLGLGVAGLIALRRRKRQAA